MIECNLCQQQFNENDNLIIIQLTKHTEWHEKARMQKRNTVQGTPEWTTLY